MTVAVAGAEFGWGSSGKLSAVLAALRGRAARPLRFVGLASGLGRPLLAEHPIDRWYDLPGSAHDVPGALTDVVRAERVDAAVVVLDGAAAMALETAGVPTVFVDSLPFLWTEGDRSALPLDVSAYCAQSCVELPAECRGVLESVRALHWVEAVIGTGPGAGAAPAAPAGPFRTALVSLGGLRAPHLGDWTPYPRLVVPAALEALAAYGVREVHVAGNLPAGTAEQIANGPASAPVRVTAGALSHSAFLRRLADCDVLLASPGLTTLLEAGSLAVPTVCLPPQNLSQIFNGRFHSRAVRRDVRVVWPSGVFAEDEALALRAAGEDAALQVIYRGIAGAAAAPDRRRSTAGAVRDGVLAALHRATPAADWGGLTGSVGTRGAAQVADTLLGILPRAPLPA
ncbi:hydroxymethylcytosylglucuronate/cytosylglucuronate synthase [Streptomyces sp. NPDC046215]|uniref:hydroxymethylcytosylglucuronate/cytosylglucurona te synthase n=1 Tax=Streptomyces TaxID=1883 RepID=UPI0031DBCEF8